MFTVPNLHDSIAQFIHALTHEDPISFRNICPHSEYFELFQIPNCKVSYADISLENVPFMLDNMGQRYMLAILAYTKIVLFDDLKSEEVAELLASLRGEHGKAQVNFHADNQTVTVTGYLFLQVKQETQGFTFTVLTEDSIKKNKNHIIAQVRVEFQKLLAKFKKHIAVQENREPELTAPIKINEATDLATHANRKAQYLLGWEVKLNGDTTCENFIKTQLLDKATFESLESGLELIYEDSKLIKAYDHNSGDKTERALTHLELGKSYIDYPTNKLESIHFDENGAHYIGGEPPNCFQIPQSLAPVPFQYLGCIHDSDPYFHWLPFSLHLCCPIYLNFRHLFLDYTEPNAPKVVNKEEIESADDSYEKSLKQDSLIIFEKKHFSRVRYSDRDNIGYVGVPFWVQYPDIPVCPVSGKLMKFVCQLTMDIDLKTVRDNIIPTKPYLREYFEKLNFWGDGDLFIFFQPESKIACYIIQNT